MKEEEEVNRGQKVSSGTEKSNDGHPFTFFFRASLQLVFIYISGNWLIRSQKAPGEGRVGVDSKLVAGLDE